MKKNWFYMRRYHKCLSCYEKLSTIRGVLLKKQTTPGKLGALFREMVVLIRSLEWPRLRHLVNSTARLVVTWQKIEKARVKRSRCTLTTMGNHQRAFELLYSGKLGGSVRRESLLPSPLGSFRVLASDWRHVPRETNEYRGTPARLTTRWCQNNAVKEEKEIFFPLSLFFFNYTMKTIDEET